ncbi:MAG TPA: CHAD domain-containing protein [Acetobacteraceae bacterium]|nr:CHAD domain-containing protein [Acetobacteraceae bacterium]
MEDASPLTLEAALPPELAARLLHHPVIAAHRTGRGRGMAEARIWRDTAEGTLAGQDLLLEERRGRQRLIRILPAGDTPWCPGMPDETGPPLPRGATPPEAGSDALVPVAAFEGRQQVAPLGPMKALLLHGTLRTVAAERPAARLLLSGPAGPVTALMRELAAALPLLPPTATLAEEGRALARGEAARPRRQGLADVSGAATVEDALARAIGHLLDVVLVQAPLAAAGSGPQGVHQLRVALRRLRSALRVFRGAVDGPALRALDGALRGILAALGPARDWDVWIEGLGAEIAAAMPEEARIAELRAAAEAQREAAYGALRPVLEGPLFRATIWEGVTLVTLRGWREDATEAMRTALEGMPAEYGAALLSRRWKRLRRDARDLDRLDSAALHELRLDAKRLRYAGEMFAPLWPGKAARRFLRRVARLQDALGLANDVSVARALIAPLASPRNGMGWAVGVAEGWAAARLRDTRRDVARCWKRMARTDCFWAGS